ncbi:MAG: hypothetical protein AAB263_06200 [Planctomycetota bacterium]
MSQAVIAGIDLPLSAADDGWMGFQQTNRLIQGVITVLPDTPKRIDDLGQVAVGVVLIGGDRRCREGGVY